MALYCTRHHCYHSAPLRHGRRCSYIAFCMQPLPKSVKSSERHTARHVKIFPLSRRRPTRCVQSVEARSTSKTRSVVPDENPQVRTCFRAQRRVRNNSVMTRTTSLQTSPLPQIHFRKIESESNTRFFCCFVYKDCSILPTGWLIKMNAEMSSCIRWEPAVRRTILNSI